MPPFLPRKRLRSPSPEAGPSKPDRGKGRPTSTTPRKPTLFDDLDAGTGQKRTPEHSKALLDKLAASEEQESTSESSEDEFEDVPALKRQKVDDASDDDEDIEFEDVQTHAEPGPSAPPPSGDLELTLRKDTRVSLTNPLGTKKGPSKIERGIRIATHQMHVQMLMWHNALRNSWLCDKELQTILLEQLPPGIRKEVEKWKQHSGIKPEKETPKQKGKGKGKVVISKGKKADSRSQRDWGEPAANLNAELGNTSSSDPLIRLLRVLIEYWKVKFTITVPGLRKLGYMSLERLDAEMKSYNNDTHDPELHGERIRGISEFRERAKALDGSRDVGAQLFTALLRGLGIEARMVANLQPLGFGWSQNEEASERNPRKLKKQAAKKEDSSDEQDDSDSEQLSSKPLKNGKARATTKSKKTVTVKRTPAKRGRKATGLKESPIDLSESEEATPGSEDDESVIDVTPAARRASKAYDKDLLFPHYWTEVLSPITNTYTAVDAVVLHKVATKPEIVELFEPRGGKAEKAKQVTSYIIGHSPDGTAKDVTTRYLKRQVWPGRTKGNRIPAEKIPVYNRHGKVKRYESYDWFKAVMSAYVRGTKKAPRTEIDDYEDLTALKPAKPEKKVVEEGKETLQFYKTSPDYVLERHLKREEAILPTAKHVKMFAVKGKGNTSVDEKVYLRKDVVSCKTIETWHKEGRVPIEGEEPLKRVPYRAATINRRRELADAEQATGEKALQGLYSWDQTEWIIPPPIQNGIIPKNNFGNIDLYVDSMLPQGAVHIPRRGTVKICKRLGIDYAEAVTGFEFGYRMAVPVITGVVVAQEHLEAVMEEWEKDEAERARKEDEKRHKAAIGMWRKMLMGLRIVERMRQEYGDEAGDEVDLFNPWTNKNKGKAAEQDVEAQARVMGQRDEDMAGGFLPEGHDEEEPDDHHGTGFFPVARDEDDDDESDGGFIVEGHAEQPKATIAQAYATPQSLQSNIKTGKASLLDEDEDEDMEDAEPDPKPKPAPTKRRGRPPGSAKKPTKPPPAQASRPKTKTPAKKPPKLQRRKMKINDSAAEEDDDDDDDDDASSLSSLPSSSDDADPEPKRSARGGAKTSTAQRKTPQRSAARKSVDALRSHYFAHSDEDDDEEEADN